MKDLKAGLICLVGLKAGEFAGLTKDPQAGGFSFMCLEKAFGRTLASTPWYDEITVGAWSRQDIEVRPHIVGQICNSVNCALVRNKPLRNGAKRLLQALETKDGSKLAQFIWSAGTDPSFFV